MERASTFADLVKWWCIWKYRRFIMMIWYFKFDVLSVLGCTDCCHSTLRSLPYLSVFTSTSNSGGQNYGLSHMAGMFHHSRAPSLWCVSLDTIGLLDGRCLAWSLLYNNDLHLGYSSCCSRVLNCWRVYNSRQTQESSSQQPHHLWYICIIGYHVLDLSLLQRTT